MDAVWQELIKALPWGFVLIVMRWLEIKDQKEQRIERAANAAQKAEDERKFAAEKSESERKYDMEKNKLWSESIKYSIDKQSESSIAITTAIKEMQKDLQEKYESMGITKDLLDAARRELAKQRRSDQ